MIPSFTKGACVKSEIAENARRIEELEQQVMAVKADSAAALRSVNVATRYASRVQNVARQEGDPFGLAMANLIDADLQALEARGK